MRPQFNTERAGHPLIADRPFVAYIPELVAALNGNALDALIVQTIWYATDDMGEALLSYREVAARIDQPLATVGRHLDSLKKRHILTNRVSGGPGSRSAWTVHPSAIPTQNGYTESSTGVPTMETPQIGEGSTQNEYEGVPEMSIPSYKKSEEVGLEVVGTTSVVGVPEPSTPTPNSSNPPVTQSDSPPLWVQQIPWLGPDRWAMCITFARHADPVASAGSYLAWCAEHPDAAETFAGFWKWLTKDEKDAKDRALANNSEAAFIDFIYHRQNHDEVDA